MRLKTLWYLSEIAIFLLYFGIFYVIGNSLLWGFLGATIIMTLHHLVRKTLSKVKIGDE